MKQKDALDKSSISDSRGSLPSDSKFVSIVCQARMVSTRDNGIYIGSGLRGVLPYVQCRTVVFPC
jgi:hypothetical protein